MPSSASYVIRSHSIIHSTTLKLHTQPRLLKHSLHPGMSQASKVYARLLLPKKLGFPLWTPAPDGNLPSEYREKGISIGDVGIITADGGFDFLFNICVPSDHPVNYRGVPDGFQNVSELTPPIEISRQDDYHCPNVPIASTSMACKNIDANLAVAANPYVYSTL